MTLSPDIYSSINPSALLISHYVRLLGRLVRSASIRQGGTERADLHRNLQLADGQRAGHHHCRRQEQCPSRYPGRRPRVIRQGGVAGTARGPQDKERRACDDGYVQIDRADEEVHLAAGPQGQRGEVVDELQNRRQRRKLTLLPGQEAHRLPLQTIRLQEPAQGAGANVQVP